MQIKPTFKVPFTVQPTRRPAGFHASAKLAEALRQGGCRWELRLAATQTGALSATSSTWVGVGPAEKHVTLPDQATAVNRDEQRGITGLVAFVKLW